MSRHPMFVLCRVLGDAPNSSVTSRPVPTTVSLTSSTLPTVSVTCEDPTRGIANSYTFHKAFNGHQSHALRDFLVSQTLERVVSNQNTSLLLYGASGTGKSTTIFSNDCGVLPAIANGLFDRKESVESAHDGSQLSISVSCFSVFNEAIYDYLELASLAAIPHSPKSPHLSVRRGTSMIGKKPSRVGIESPATMHLKAGDSSELLCLDNPVGLTAKTGSSINGFGRTSRGVSPAASPFDEDLQPPTQPMPISMTPSVPQNVRVVAVNSLAELMTSLNIAADARLNGPTSFNRMSSCLVQITVKHTNVQTGMACISTVLVADLQCSDRIPPGMQDYKKVVAAMGALRRVAVALCAKQRVIPTRDSLLTTFLAEALGGNSFTTIVATVSSNYEKFQDTCQTLQFVSAMRDVLCRPVENRSKVAVAVNELKRELDSLRVRLAHPVDDDAVPAKANIEKLLGKTEKDRAMLEQSIMRREETTAAVKANVEFTHSKLEKVKTNLAEMLRLKREAEELAVNAKTTMEETRALQAEQSRQDFELLNAEQEIDELAHSILHRQTAARREDERAAQLRSEEDDQAKLSFATIFRTATIAKKSERQKRDLRRRILALGNREKALRAKIEDLIPQMFAVDREVFMVDDESDRLERKCSKIAIAFERANDASAFDCIEEATRVIVADTKRKRKDLAFLEEQRTAAIYDHFLIVRSQLLPQLERAERVILEKRWMSELGSARRLLEESLIMVLEHGKFVQLMYYEWLLITERAVVNCIQERSAFCSVLHDFISKNNPNTIRRDAAVIQQKLELLQDQLVERLKVYGVVKTAYHEVCEVAAVRLVAPS